MRHRVVVIGAGLGGLSAACALAGRDHDVTVLEAAPVPGGRAGTAWEKGYRFDTGPTVLTMPEIVDRCFEAAGVNRESLLKLRRVDPMYRACFPDGSEIRVRHGEGPMAAEIESVCGKREAEAFVRFCAWLRHLYEVEMPSFIDRNYDSPFDLLRPLGPVLRLLRLGGFRRLSAAVAGFFEDQRLRQIFSFQSMYAGLSPDQALALYGVITFMDTVNGVFIPEGGMHALPTALAEAAELAGAKFRYGARAERILLRQGSTGPVCGVRLAGGEVVDATAVVVNADLPVAYRTLLPGLAPPRAVRRGRYSPSALVWNVGARGTLPPGVEQHNIHFGRSWDGAFRALMDEGVRMPDPSLFVSVPSLDESSMAPRGASSLYVLEPVPNLDGSVDWTTERQRAREQLAVRIADLGYPTDIEAEMLTDPLDWEAQGMERGTPFALSHRFFQTGPFRPGNVERRAPGVVFAGSYTVPGVGVPMVLLSGLLATERIEGLDVR